MIRLIFTFLPIIAACACSPEEEANRTQPVKEEILRYYAADSTAAPDTLKACFSCNQADLYDLSGKHIEHRFYIGASDSMFGYEVFEHNELGQKIGSRYYEGDSLTATYQYELDDQGRIRIGRAYNALTGEMLYGYRYTYNALGQAYETASLDNEGEIVNYYRRVYNEAGVVISENIEDLNDVPTFRVHYDYKPLADSSWEKQIVYYNDKLSEVRLRERTYFN